ncbi:MAG: aminotransferase class I and II [Chloroflexota bacterium]|nr:MAG: aminotransferase class I and II [Chloroflexota bacterium]
MPRTVTATRYVTPLREGGSLPAIVEADDDGMYVLKFRGAGQGPKVLIAELICGEIGRALGLPVPEIVFVEVDEALGRNEPDFEIQALVAASAGLNLGIDYLPGALGFDPLAVRQVDPELAAAVVWFDALMTNVDRTPRNPNLLLWHRRLWLIDHGAALYVHHTWANYMERATSPFTAIKDHVLLPAAGDLRAADAELAARVTPELVAAAVEAVPEEWLLAAQSPFADAAEHRAAYVAYLSRRLEAPRAFAEEAAHARAQRV